MFVMLDMSVACAFIFMCKSENLVMDNSEKPHIGLQHQYIGKVTRRLKLH